MLQRVSQIGQFGSFLIEERSVPVLKYEKLNPKERIYNWR
jgi:hypothetical protein